MPTPDKKPIAPETMIGILKETMPFEVVSETLLRKIAASCWQVSYRKGDTVYEAGEKADDVYIVMSGSVEHELVPGAQARRPAKTLAKGDVFGWAALLEKSRVRLAKAVCAEDALLVCINADELLRLLESDPDAGDVVMSRFATMITRDFTLPDLMAQMRRIHRKMHAKESQGINITLYRLGRWLKSPRPYLLFVGLAIFFGCCYLFVEVWKLPRFKEMPGLTAVVKECSIPTRSTGSPSTPASTTSTSWCRSGG